jgi:predicted porin
METKKLAIAALLASATGVAHAQSSVTLYGIVDEAVEYVSNVGGHSLYGMTNPMAPDMFGLRGVEDLGGGLSAVFELQSEFFANSGKMIVPGEIFNRKAFVGVRSETYGTLTLGHQPDFMYDILGGYQSSLVLGNLLSLHEGNFDEAANLSQFDNSAKYVSATYGGFRFGSQFGFGNQAGDFAAGRKYSFFADYKRGPFSIGAVYANENNRFLEGSGFVGLTSLFGTPLPSATGVVANKLVNWGIGTSYTLKDWLFHATFSQSRITLLTGQGSANTVDAGVNWTVTPYDIIALGGWVENLDGGQWKTVTLSNSYLLSKQTVFYQKITYQRASGENAVASLFGAGVASGKSIVGVTVGIEHVF